MMPIDLSAGKPIPTHSSYADDSIARQFWRRSFRVGRDYITGDDEHGNPVIIKHEVEQQKAYDRRLQSTQARNYAGPIIRQYNNFVHRKSADYPDGSESMPVYGLLLEDINGKGVSANEFMRRALLVAQVDREIYLLADTTADPGTDRTLAQAMEGRVRPIVRSINADQVLWWRYEDGELIEAIYLFTRRGQHFARYVNDEIIIEMMVRSEQHGTPTILGVEDPIPNPYGMMPLVPLRPQFDDFGDGQGESQIAPLAYAQKKIANLLSLEAEELTANTYTQWVLATDANTAQPTSDGSKSPSTNKITFGAKRLITVPAGSTVSRIGSDVAQADSIRAAIANEERALYRIAGVSSGDPLAGPGAVESGVAKAFRFNDLAANLSALADAEQYAFNRVMQVIHTGQGIPYPGDANFPDDFSMPDFIAELRETIDVISRPAMPSVIRQETVKRMAQRLFELTDEQLAELSLESATIGRPTPFSFVSNEAS